MPYEFSPSFQAVVEKLRVRLKAKDPDLMYQRLSENDRRVILHLITAYKKTMKNMGKG